MEKRRKWKRRGNGKVTEMETEMETEKETEKKGYREDFCL